MRSFATIGASCGLLLLQAAASATPLPPAPGADGMIAPAPLPRSGPRPPWPRRQRIGVRVMPDWAARLRPRDLEQQGMLPEAVRALGMPARQLRALGIRPAGQGLIELGRWPAEPPAPRRVAPQRLSEALRQLCPPLIPREVLARYAEWIVEHSAHFEVDPLLLAALIYQQSRCRVQARSSWGVGLALINRQMHQGRIRDGRYRYWVLEGGQWRRRQLPLERFAFTAANLTQAEPNIYFAAALLKVFAEQCPDLDGGFGSVPHRHAVSHFIWGDRVRGAGPEDRVLRARRRLLEYYRGRPVLALGRFQQLPLTCPLDGAPRKISSGWGDDREGGKRRHTGIDFDSERGEPVRAIADGTVTLAGVDRGQNRLQPLDPRLTRIVPAARMGPRGLLVAVQHTPKLISEYMHLSAYVVRTGQRVKAGELLGYVGRTGMKESDAHLHFGLRHEGRYVDPIGYFSPYVFPPDATYVGRNYLAYQRRERRLRARMPRGKWRARVERRRRRRMQELRRQVGGPARELQPRPLAEEPAAPPTYDPSRRRYQR